MNETVALRPASRPSAKEGVIDDTLASLEELEQLHSALNLLAHPPVVRGSHDFFVCCYDAGVQHAQTRKAETVAALLGSLLHLLAWKSESPWARQQAQRLLWQGGVLGERGEFALLTLDDELRERQICWPSLRSLLAVTGFLARFPAGPLFVD